MKKTMTVLLAAVLLFMISCGKDDGPAVVSSESAISVPSSASSDTEPGTSSAIIEPGSDIPSSEEADPASGEDTSATEENVFPFPTIDTGPVEYPPKSYTASVLPGKKKVSGELAEKLGVPEHVEGTFISPSGISQVYLNADVVFPDIDHVNIYKAVPGIFSQEDINYFAEYLADETDYFNDGESWFYSKNNRPWNNEAPEIDDSFRNVDHYQLWLDNLPVDLDLPLTYNEEVWKKNMAEALKEYLPEDQAENFSVKQLLVSYSLDQKTKDLSFIDPKLEYKYLRDILVIEPLENGRASDSALTLEQAVSAADEAVHGILPDFEITAYGQTAITQVYPRPRQYAFIYTRHPDGIPVNNPGNLGVAYDEYGFVSEQEELIIAVGENGIEYLRYSSPCSVGETVTENAELLPFSEIREIYEKMLLLSIQYYEINNEDLKQNLRHIYEIRFGYMTVYQNDGSYLYTPVWDFYGTRRLSGTGGYGAQDTIPPEYEDPVLTLNAITGDVIDRGLGY